MFEVLKDYLPIPGVGVAIAAANYYVFKYLNKTLNEDLRLQISLWLLGEKPKIAWDKSVLSLFNILFGPKALSLLCLRRVLTMTITVGAGAYYFLERNTKGIFADDITLVKPWLHLLAVLILWNCPIDYISVLKSRFVLRFVSRRELPIRGQVFIGAADLGAGLVLSYGTLFLLTYFMVTFPGVSSIKQTVVCVLLTLLQNCWFALYCLALIGVRLIYWISARVTFLSSYVSRRRIEDEPLTLIGELLSGLFILGAIIVTVTTLP
jgi:hypothetical protein